MARPNNAIKNVTTSFRITADMDVYIAKAADLAGMTKGEVYRLGAYETAKEIHNNPQVQEELRARFAV